MAVLVDRALHECPNVSSGKASVVFDFCSESQLPKRDHLRLYSALEEKRLEVGPGCIDRR